MKKVLVLALGVLALASCTKYKAKDIEMSGENDSINYALGYLNGAQIKMQFLRDSTADQDEAVKEFVDALQRGWDGKVEELTQAQEIGQNIGHAIKESEKNGLANNPAWAIDEKVFFQGLVNGVEGYDSVMNANDARMYFQTQYQASQANEPTQDKAKKSKCGNKAKYIELKTASDSLNYAFGMLNGSEIGMYVLAGDTDNTAHKEFYAAINKALKDKVQFPQLVQMGQQIGQTIKEQSAQGLIGDSTLTTDFELIKQGFINGMYDYNWSAEEANAYIMGVLNGKKIAEGRKFLEENAKKDSVQVTASGLQYKVLVMGNGPKPDSTATVTVNYEGTLIDGTVFDSSYQRGEPISFALNQVIKGWTEGLQLMPVGSTFMLYIPYELGYGDHAAGRIPACATLIFKVELLSIGDTTKKK